MAISFIPFPQIPSVCLKTILDTKEIIVGDYDVNDPFVPGTFHVFDTVNPALLRAIIDELGLDTASLTPDYRSNHDNPQLSMAPEQRLDVCTPCFGTRMV